MLDPWKLAQTRIVTSSKGWHSSSCYHSVIPTADPTVTSPSLTVNASQPYPGFISLPFRGMILPSM